MKLLDLRNWLTAFKEAAWLGWVLEGNWTTPLLFIGYSVIRPLSAALILVFIYLVVTQGKTQAETFRNLYVGNAFYIFVGYILFGLSIIIHEDRERYEVLRYLYIAPSSFFVYLLGRGVAKLILAAISVVVTLLFGATVLHVTIPLLKMNYPLFVSVFLAGLIGIASIGMILVSITTIMARHSVSWYIGESVAGVFYFLSGVIFPISILPSWLQPLSFILPVTYWIEGIRRGIYPGYRGEVFAGLTDVGILGITVLSSLIIAILAIFLFRWMNEVALRNGLIDMKTFY